MWKQLFSSGGDRKSGRNGLDGHRRNREKEASSSSRNARIDAFLSSSDSPPAPRGLKRVIEHLQRKREAAEAEAALAVGVNKKVPSYVVDALGPGWKLRGGLGSGAYAKVFEATWVGEKRIFVHNLGATASGDFQRNGSKNSLSSLSAFGFSTTAHQQQQRGADEKGELSPRRRDVACAVKVMRDVDMESWEISRRFVRELLILRRLRAVDGVVSLYGCTTPKASSSRHKRDLYLFFEACLTDFRQLTKMDVFLTLPDARRLLRELLTAVAFMHASDIIHRDIKPANLLLHADGTLKVCDFGLARVVPPAPRSGSLDDDGDGNVAFSDSFGAPSFPLPGETSKNDLKKLGGSSMEPELSSSRSPRMMSPDLDEAVDHGNVDDDDDDVPCGGLKNLPPGANVYPVDVLDDDTRRRRMPPYPAPPQAAPFSPGQRQEGLLGGGTHDAPPLLRPPLVRDLSDAKAPKVAPDQQKEDDMLPACDPSAQEKGFSQRPSSSKKRVAFAVDGDGEDEPYGSADSLADYAEKHGSGDDAKGARKGPSSASSLPRAELRRMYTEHVVTRWYRAPELVLLQPYNGAVDVWAAACVFAECFLGTCVEVCPDRRDRRPLFPGRSCYPLSPMGTTRDGWHQKNDQLQAIFNVRGTPSIAEIDALDNDYRGMKNYLRRLPAVETVPLQQIFPAADAKAIDLLEKMLAFSPDQRISISEALAHGYLTSPSSSRATTPRDTTTTTTQSHEDGFTRLKASPSDGELETPATTGPRQPDHRDAGFGDWSPPKTLTSRPSKTALGPAMSQLEDDEAWERVAQHEADADMSRVLWKLVQCFPSELAPSGGLVGDAAAEKRAPFLGGDHLSELSSDAGSSTWTARDDDDDRSQRSFGQKPGGQPGGTFLKRRTSKLGISQYWTNFLDQRKQRRSQQQQHK